LEVPDGRDGEDEDVDVFDDVLLLFEVSEAAMLDWNCPEMSYEHGWQDEKCQTIDAYGVGVRTRVQNFIEWR
jgi:hypothetical protein